MQNLLTIESTFFEKRYKISAWEELKGKYKKNAFIQKDTKIGECAFLYRDSKRPYLCPGSKRVYVLCSQFKCDKPVWFSLAD